MRCSSICRICRSSGGFECIINLSPQGIQLFLDTFTGIGLQIVVGRPQSRKNSFSVFLGIFIEIDVSMYVGDSYNVFL